VEVLELSGTILCLDVHFLESRRTFSSIKLFSRKEATLKVDGSIGNTIFFVISDNKNTINSTIQQLLLNAIRLFIFLAIKATKSAFSNYSGIRFM
jgi:hypothetical protein